MKAIGIVRPVDELGRIVIPIELRRILNIVEKDALEIYTDGDAIILKKYNLKCILCGDSQAITKFKNKLICKECINYIKL